MSFGSLLCQYCANMSISSRAGALGSHAFQIRIRGRTEGRLKMALSDADSTAKLRGERERQAVPLVARCAGHDLPVKFDSPGCWKRCGWAGSLGA